MSERAMIVLIDDRRVFTDGREAEVFDNLHEGLNFLHGVWRRGETIEELWLDHDLGYCPDHGVETIMPVVEFLEERAVWSEPVKIDTVYVHTANPGAQFKIVRALNAREYRAFAINADWEGILIDKEWK